jgi:hypothetical protein
MVTLWTISMVCFTVGTVLMVLPIVLHYAVGRHGRH